MVALLTSVQSTFAQLITDPRAVVDTYQRARAEGNIDAALAQFADNAVVTVQGRESQSYTGKDQVKVFLQTFGLDYQTIMQSVPRVEGAAVMWTERDQGSRQSVDAQVQATVQSAGITSLLYIQGEPFGVPPKRVATPAPPPAPRQIPSAAFSAGLAALGLLLLMVIFRRPRRQAPSRLDGQLLTSMQRARRLREDKRKAA